MVLLRTVFRFAAVAAFSATFAACGGGQSSLNATPAVDALVTPAPTATPNANASKYVVVSTGSNSAITLVGVVASISSGSFLIQGGSGVGYLRIYTSSTTAYAGKKPYAGETVEISGAGTVSTSVKATSVTQLLTVTASVTRLGSNGSFLIHGSSYVWVYPTSTTVYSGAKPYVGESVAIAATGSFSSSLKAVTIAQASGASATASPSPTAKPAATAAPTPAPAGTAPPIATTSPTSTPGPAYTAPPTTAFMPSSWGKISAFQVFDDTGNGYITESAASQNGWRYSSVWGSRWNIGTSWNNSNSQLETSYYNALETDPSYTGWGAIGHDLTWWKANHPDWVLYACTSANAPTTNPAYVPGLTTNIPLDIHNPSVVQYQIRAMANYAHKIGYHALAIDEATFWQADQGAGSGSFGCGIYQNGSFVRRYNGVDDANWAADVVAWAKIAHSILTTDPTISTYHLKLIVNHPAGNLSANETAFLANIDAALDETGYSDYGRYKTSSASYFAMRTNWAMYAQQHHVAVLMNDNWGSLPVTTPLLDYSIATYLMGDLQAESLFASPATGYGVEQWHSQYQSAIGAPCGAYYGGSSYDSASPSIYYRRFANAIVVVNGGSGSASQTAHLPTGHTYTDILGRAVSNPLTIASNDGYVLLTSNGCK